MAAAYVQSKSATSDGSTSVATQAVTLTNPVGNGNLVCGAVSWGNQNTISLNTVTDDKGNSYTIVRTVIYTTNQIAEATFYRKNITNAPQTITANYSGGTIFRAMSAHEVSGCDTTNPLDVETGQLLTGTTSVTSGNVTTTADGDYIFGVAFDVGNLHAIPYFTPTGSYTKREEQGSSSTIDVCSEDQVQTSQGSIAATFTQGATDAVLCSILTFKAATGGGGGGAAPSAHLLASMGFGR